MSQSHVMCELYLGGDYETPSTVLWSVKPKGRAVIFVHGFGGEALGTWRDFELFLPQLPEFRGHDCFFFGYDGLTTHASESAERLHSFLDALMRAPEQLFRRALPPSMAPTRATRFRYDDGVILAHSLGAVVTRMALISEYQGGDRWLERMRSVYFAPAHSGSGGLDTIVSMLTSLNLMGVGLVANGAMGLLPAASDLRQGSPCLTELRENFAALPMPTKLRIIPKAVVWAPRDGVVVNRKFPGDPKPILVDGASHTSVCKPRSEFKRPLEILVEHL